MSTQGNKGLLALEDGSEFYGELRGAPINREKIIACAQVGAESRDKGYGEVVFNTSMTGYQEVLTDPSYYGQIVCMTAAHIGNTGANFEDDESHKAWCGGFVIRNYCETPSNWRSKETLESFLIRNDIPALIDADTRAITRHLRTKGVVRGVIVPESEKSFAQDLLKKLPGFEGRDLIKEVTTKQPYFWGKHSNAPSVGKGIRIVAIDYGIKRNMLRAFEERGCSVTVVPATSTPDEVLIHRPHGIFLSNGPGDPAAATYAVDTIRTLLGQIPIFGVCMGHQILSLALGAKTYKLKFGHRGSNQPVQVKPHNKVEISSHNHGYAVDATTLPKDAEVSHINLNDQSCEGVRVPSKRAFSVQYHPEACPGPHDSTALFDEFLQPLREAL